MRTQVPLLCWYRTIRFPAGAGHLCEGPYRPFVARAVRRPTHAPGRVYGTSKECRLPHRLPRPTVQEQFPRRAVGRHRLTAVGEMPRWVQRVAPLRVRRAAHRRQRKTRTRLARTIVIDGHRARPRPSAEHAARRQHRPENPILVRLVRRRDEGSVEERLARSAAPWHIFPCWLVPPPPRSRGRGTIAVKPAAPQRCGLLTVCSFDRLHNRPRPQPHAIIPATGTPSHRHWAGYATPLPFARLDLPSNHLPT